VHHELWLTFIVRVVLLEFQQFLLATLAKRPAELGIVPLGGNLVGERISP